MNFSAKESTNEANFILRINRHTREFDISLQMQYSSFASINFSLVGLLADRPGVLTDGARISDRLLDLLLLNLWRLIEGGYKHDIDLVQG